MTPDNSTIETAARVLTHARLSPSATAVLLTLHKRGQLRMGVLAQECGLHTANLSDIVRDLGKKGLVFSVRNRQAVTAYLADAGMSHVERVISEFNKSIKAI